MSREDELLRKLAFQRGFLALLKESRPALQGLEKAIDDIDSLMEELAGLRVR